MGRLTSDSTGTPVSTSSSTTSDNKKKGKEARPKARHHSKQSAQSVLESAYASTGSLTGKKKHGLTKQLKKKITHDPYADMGQSARSSIPRPDESVKRNDYYIFLKVQDKPLDDDVTLAL